MATIPICFILNISIPAEGRLYKEIEDRVAQMSTFLENGRIKVTQMRRNYDFEIKDVKVFAPANDIKRLSAPLQSRFRKLFLPRYTEQVLGCFGEGSFTQ